MPALSIIIPVYKVEKYLNACVESVLSQTGVQQTELILVDDGSPDSCGALCDAWAEKCGNVTALHKQNGGLSDARNAGLAAAKGEYVMFLDSDDTLLPGALERTLSLCAMHTPQVLIGHYTTVCEATGAVLLEKDSQLDAARINGQSADSVVTELRRARTSPCAWRFTVERAWLLHHGLLFEKGLISEDAMWTPRVLCTAERFWINEQPFYRYLVRAESIMTTPSFKRLTDLLYICESQYAFAAPLSAPKRDYVAGMICILLNNLLQSYGGLRAAQRSVIDAWFCAHADIAWAAARQQPAIDAAARVLGVQRAMRLAARAVSLRLRLRGQYKARGQ